jgi:hypothetical protein
LLPSHPISRHLIASGMDEQNASSGTEIGGSGCGARVGVGAVPIF